MSEKLQTPVILEKTRNGLQQVRIIDDMLRNRQISLLGPVDEAAVNSLITQLLYLERSAPGEEITFYINSGGGEVGNGLALYDVMQSISSPIRTVCMGLAASMAAVLFAAGEHRQLYEHSRIMIHDPSISGNLVSKALELQSLSEDLMQTRRALAEILARHTGRPLEEIYEKTRVDTFFDAETAIEFGLADEVIGRTRGGKE